MTHATALTEVELLWVEGRVERWIRFGRPVAERILDAHRRVVAFEPGSVFGYVRWASNGYGTVASRLDVLRAVAPGEACSTVPFVAPGAEILVRVSGWPRVERGLHAIDAVEALGLEPADAAPDHWRHVHNRLAADEIPRPYTRERHRAWLLRRRIEA